MRLVLIRHGESKHSQSGIITGPGSCPGMSERGFAQVRKLTRHLEETRELADCKALFSSPALRARQTAETLLPVFPGLSIQEDIHLYEILPGEAEGLTWDAYRAKYGEFDAMASPDRVFAPGGESWNIFHDRVDATLERLASQYAGQTVAAVTHAGFIVAAMLILFDIPRPGTGAWITPANASLTEWTVTDGKWQLDSYNDVHHLVEGK